MSRLVKRCKGLFQVMVLIMVPLSPLDTRKTTYSRIKLFLFSLVPRESRAVGYVLSLEWNQFEELCLDWLSDSKVVFS